MAEAEEIREKIDLGGWSHDGFNEVLSRASKITLIQDRLAFLSERFSGVPYQADTLIGGIDAPENFVVDFTALDCFTFLDYIAAMSISADFEDFKKNLRRIRYRQGQVAFLERNHFFTDWIYSNPDLFRDITKEIGAEAAVSVTKELNRKEDGALYVNGITVNVRELSYLPTEALDETVLSKISTGDYAGVYSYKAGLDVSHVGILIKKKDGVFIRHASSVKKKVLDEPLTGYLDGKPGLVILRQAGDP